MNGKKCNFKAVMQILRQNTLRPCVKNQQFLVEALFATFSAEKYPETGICLSNANRWVSGTRYVPCYIADYYVGAHQSDMVCDVEAGIIPALADVGRAIAQLHDLIMGDGTISNPKKSQLLKNYPDNPAGLITDIVIYSISRPGIA